MVKFKTLIIYFRDRWYCECRINSTPKAVLSPSHELWWEHFSLHYLWTLLNFISWEWVPYFSLEDMSIPNLNCTMVPMTTDYLFLDHMGRNSHHTLLFCMLQSLTSLLPLAGILWLTSFITILKAHHKLFWITEDLQHLYKNDHLLLCTCTPCWFCTQTTLPEAKFSSPHYQMCLCPVYGIIRSTKRIRNMKNCILNIYKL